MLRLLHEELLFKFEEMGYERGFDIYEERNIGLGDSEIAGGEGREGGERLE